MECLTPALAVFNGHINDADKRARASMAKECPSYLEIVLAAEQRGNGIMHVFNPNVWWTRTGKPNHAVRRYVALVTAFVNEGRSETSGAAEARLDEGRGG